MEVKKKNEREKSRSTNGALGIRCEWWLGVVGGGMDQRLKLALVLDATHDDTHILTPSLLLVRNAEAFRTGRFMCVLVCEDTLNENSVSTFMCITLADKCRGCKCTAITLSFGVKVLSAVVRCPTSLGCHGSRGNWSTACLPADLRTDGVQLLMCCGIYYLFIKGWSLKEEKHEVVQSRRLSHASYSRLKSGKTAVPATI